MSPQIVSIPYGSEEIRFEVPDSHPLEVLCPGKDLPSTFKVKVEGKDYYDEGTVALVDPHLNVPSQAGTPKMDEGAVALNPNLNASSQAGTQNGDEGAVALRRAVEEAIRQALNEPIAAPPLGQFVNESLSRARQGSRAVILVDDLTRPTPQDAILPILLDELNRGGVPDEQVTVLIALGTHRPMTAAEILQRFGEAVTRRVPVINNPWQDSAQMVDLGLTPNGTPVQVSRLALEAGFLFGVGSIVPHHIPGFSGGAKIVQPGITGAATTGATHLLSTRTRRSYLGLIENPVRAEMEYIAEKVGLKAIFNTVLGPDASLVRAFYGEPRLAFRQGAALAAQVWGAKTTFAPQIVVAGSHPCDIEFWQAHKSLYPADMLLKDGGTLILVTPCPEGVSVMHPEVLEYAGLPPEEILARIESGAIPDVAAGALALAWAKVRQRLHISLVSHGIPPAAARALGFQPFSSIEEALTDSFHHHGSQAAVAVLPYAPDTLPL